MEVDKFLEMTHRLGVTDIFLHFRLSLFSDIPLATLGLLCKHAEIEQGALESLPM